MPKGLPNLLGLDRNELASVLAPLDARPFHAAQLFHQMYGRLETDFRAMTDLSSALRRELADRFRVALPEIKTVRRSTDSRRTSEPAGACRVRGSRWSCSTTSPCSRTSSWRPARSGP